MAQSLKTTWDDIQHLMPMDINHPAINMLINGHGQKINIHVFLQQEKQQVLAATVSLLPSPNFLQTAALAVLLQKMEQQDINLKWDTASFGTPDTPQIPKGAFDLKDPFVQWVEMGVIFELDMCLEAHKEISARMKEQSEEFYKQQSPANLAAIFIGATAIVRSEKLEELVAKKKSILPILLNFEPKGYEF